MARCEYSCAYLLPIAHTRLRVHRAPGIPHALCFQGGCFWQTSGASRREIAEMCLRHCERSEASSTVIPGRCEASNPESRDSPMCNCTSEVWCWRTIPE